MLRFAFLGAWHSHASMHVREAASRLGEVELVGMYDADPAVIQQNLERWAEYGLDIPVFDSVEDVLNSRAETVVVEGHVYQNLDYAERGARRWQARIVGKASRRRSSPIREAPQARRERGADATNGLYVALQSGGS